MLKNDRNPFLVMIITSWVLLIIAMILKLFGADWFIAGSENKTFIRLCNFIDSHFAVQCIVFALFNIFTTSIYFMAILKETRPHLVWFLILIVYASVKVVFYNKVVFFILDIILMVVLPLILKPKYWIAILVGFVLNFGFQLISMATKMNNYKMFDENTLVGIILNIDYILMLTLFWLYRIKPNKKEVSNNG